MKIFITTLIIYLGAALFLINSSAVKAQVAGYEHFKMYCIVSLHYAVVVVEMSSIFIYNKRNNNNNNNNIATLIYCTFFTHPIPVWLLLYLDNSR